MCYVGYILGTLELTTSLMENFPQSASRVTPVDPNLGRDDEDKMTQEETDKKNQEKRDRSESR